MFSVTFPGLSQAYWHTTQQSLLYCKERFLLYIKHVELKVAKWDLLIKYYFFIFWGEEGEGYKTISYKYSEKGIWLQLVYKWIDDYFTLPKTPPIIGTGKYHISLIWGEVNIPAIFILQVGPFIDLKLIRLELCSETENIH